MVVRVASDEGEVDELVTSTEEVSRVENLIEIINEPGRHDVLDYYRQVGIREVTSLVGKQN